MATFYERMRDGVAGPAITKFGRKVTLIVASDAAYDPATGKSSVTERRYTVDALVLNYNVQSGGAQAKDGLIQADDKQIYMSAKGLSATPKAGDRVQIGSDILGIVRVLTLAPAGTAVFHEVQARR